MIIVAYFLFICKLVSLSLSIVSQLFAPQVHLPSKKFWNTAPPMRALSVNVTVVIDADWREFRYATWRSCYRCKVFNNRLLMFNTTERWFHLHLDCLISGLPQCGDSHEWRWVKSIAPWTSRLLKVPRAAVEKQISACIRHHFVWLKLALAHKLKATGTHV